MRTGSTSVFLWAAGLGARSVPAASMVTQCVAPVAVGARTPSGSRAGAMGDRGAPIYDRVTPEASARAIRSEVDP